MRTTHIIGTLPGVDEDEDNLSEFFFSYNSSKPARGLLPYILLS